MGRTPTVVEKRIRLSVERANRLNRLAEIHQIGEDQITERALDTTTIGERYMTFQRGDVVLEHSGSGTSRPAPAPCLGIVGSSFLDPP